MIAHDDPRSTLPASSPNESAPKSALFAPGQVIGGRYGVIRLLAEGGMGEVYEAEDRLLRERVALKTIRAQVAHDDVVVERFKREVQLARKVTHPNVCRLFDAGTHGDSCFLTMELLDGDTLSDRLVRAGCLSVQRAEPMVAQMASALAAAHRAGIVHRDFKSGNVVLVEEKGWIRAVVTDFGLARPSFEAPGQANTVTGNGGIVGSPAYMAPEQVEGGEITPAADIYALGVVMFEMVTGQLPFVADTPLATAVKRLREAPPSPRTFVPDLDEKWEQAIMRCMARKPADRFASALDVARAVGAWNEGDVTGMVPRMPRRSRWAIGAVATVALTALGVAGVRLLPSRGASAKTTTVEAAPRRLPSIAVLGFKNLSGRDETAWMSAALAEMFSTDLSAGGKLRTVPGENVGRGKKELALGEEESYAPDTLAKLRAMLGSDYVLVGFYIATGKDGGDKIRIDLRLQDTATGETIASVSETGTTAELADLVTRSGGKLRDKLAVDRPSAADERSVRASLPESAEVARLYSEGLEHFRKIECAPARESLRRAVEADPNYPLAHSALAMALNCLGLEAQAKLEARRGYDLSANLPPQISKAAEAQYRLLNNEPAKAAELYQGLFASFSDNIDYGTHVADLQMMMGKNDEARATIAALRKLPAPLSGHVYVDLTELQLAKAEHQTDRALALADALAAKAEKQGARLMVGQARFDQAFIYLENGRYDLAIAAAEQAQPIFAESGDRDGVTGAMRVIASAKMARGDLAGAHDVAIKALAIAKEIGDGRQQPSLINTLAQATAESGDLVGARRLLEDAADAAQVRGEPGDQAFMLLVLTETLLDLGDVPAALATVDRAAKLDLPGDHRYFDAWMSAERARVAEIAGDFAEARRQLASSLAFWIQIGDVMDVAEARLRLAHIAVRDGHAAEAESLARDALATIAPRGMPLLVARVSSVLADALLLEGRVADARKVLADAKQALPPTAGPAAFELEVVAARVEAASQRPADVAHAQARLEDTAAHAAALGFAAITMEARLALGEVALAARQTAVGQALLGSLEKEARARGFAGIASRAAHAKV